MGLKKYLSKIELRAWFWIHGSITLLLFNYIRFDATELVKLLAQVFIAGSLLFLTIFAIKDIRKAIKKNYFKKSKEILQKILNLRKKQISENLESQIQIDKEILTLRETLLLFQNNRFEKCFGYTLFLLILAFISTFINFGVYLNISNMAIMTVLFLWGFYYFMEMLNALIFAFEN